jgi:hypothetical protein
MGCPVQFALTRLTRRAARLDPDRLSEKIRSVAARF